MPTITKQTPPRAARGSAGGDILDDIVPVGSIHDDYIQMVIYGRNRVGKTHLACDFPKPLLLVSCEPARTGGAKTVKRVAGVSYFRIATKGYKFPDGSVQREHGVERAVRLAVRLQEKCEFATVVVDTVTSLQDLVLQEIMDLDAIPEQLNWGLVGEDQYRERSEKTRETLRPFLNLPCHVVLNAQEKDHSPPKERGSKLIRGLQDESFFAADLGGATVKWLHDACDYIAQLYLDKETRKVLSKTKVAGKEQTSEREVETGRLVRRLRTMYHTNFAAGFRSERPKEIPEFIQDPTFAKIWDLIK